MRKKILLLLSSLLCMLVLTGCGNSNEKTIVFSDAGWDSVKFHNAVAGLIAEKAYGLKVETMNGSSPILEAALVRGDVDVNMELWTDNVATYQADKAAGGIVDLSVNFDDNKQGLYVPRYVIEGDPQRGIAPVAPDLKKVADLARYSNIFVDEENPSKGRIYGAIPGWAVDEVLFKKYEYYGLDKNYIYFRPGSEATLSTAFVTAYERGLPIVGYNWEPTWISGKLDMVLLEDEPYTEQGFVEGKTAAPSVVVMVAANSRLPGRLPDYTEFLKKYHTSSALTAEALAYIADSKATYDQAARWFLQQHDDLLDQWLPQDKAEAVRAALKEK